MDSLSPVCHVPRLLQLQQPTHLLPPFGVITAHPPEGTDRSRYPQTYLSSAGLTIFFQRRCFPLTIALALPGPKQGSPDVVVLVLQPVKPLLLLRSVQVGLGLLCQPHKVQGMLPLQSFSFPCN